MTDKQFSTVWLEALEDNGSREAFVSDWATSSLFLDPMDADAKIDMSLIEKLGNIWDVAHLSMKAIQVDSGFNVSGFAAHYAIPQRTLEGWLSGRPCPPYVKLLLVESLHLIERQQF